MRMALAQLNQRLGDPAGNAGALLAAIDTGRRSGASLVVTPELSLCGYPPEDLLLRPAFLDACASELAALAAEVKGVTAIVGFPERHDGARHNAVAKARDGGVGGRGGDDGGDGHRQRQFCVFEFHGRFSWTKGTSRGASRHNAPTTLPPARCTHVTSV